MGADANALYTNADGTVDLVVLDETDCVLRVLRAGLSPTLVTGVLAGLTRYDVVGDVVDLGDGDTFVRLALV